MPGLEPGIQAHTFAFGIYAWMRGSSPRMTRR